MENDEKKPRGPEPDRLHLDEEDWERAVKKALKKPRPEGGWPSGKEPTREEEPAEPKEPEDEREKP